MPYQWSQTQENLARVLLALFERTAERPYLDAALEAVDGALEEYRKAGAAFYIEKAERLRIEILARKT